MNVFITGEKGFIGRNLVKKLQEFGFNHVSSNAEFKTPNEINLVKKVFLYKKVFW